MNQNAVAGLRLANIQDPGRCNPEGAFLCGDGKFLASCFWSRCTTFILVFLRMSWQEPVNTSFGARAKLVADNFPDREI